jgi:hypothetical protein
VSQQLSGLLIGNHQKFILAGEQAAKASQTVEIDCG